MMTAYRMGERAGLKPGEQIRNAAGRAMLAAATANEKVVVLDGDLGSSTGAHDVKKVFPDRHINVGIAEANMVGVAAGMASCGYVPICTSLSSFLFSNAHDQIRLLVSQAALNVKFVGSHSGITPGPEGPTAMSLEDFALACSFPQMAVIVPCDAPSMLAAMAAAVDYNGPAYVRSSREAMPLVYENTCPFELGKANLVRDGSDVTLIACGLMVGVSLDAAALLAAEGISARVLDMHTIKPLDRTAIAAAARETGAIVTAEEQFVTGGMGVNIARVVAETHPVPMRFIGVQAGYPGSGSVPDLMAAHGMTAEDIAAAAKDAVAAKAG
jgi:transketolase